MPEFPALYCCCSTSVARAIVIDVFRFAGVGIADLQEAAKPQLVEIHWVGRPIDMISETAIVKEGFSPGYPIGSHRAETQAAAARWHAEGAEGVLYRSASLARLGFSNWLADHSFWSELAIYTENAAVRPSVLNRGEGLDWLHSNG